QAFEVRGIDLEDRVPAVGVRFGRGQGALPRGQVVDELPRRIAQEARAVREHPGAARRRRAVRARPDAGRGQRLAQAEVGVGDGHGREAGLLPGVGLIRGHADALEGGLLEGGRALDALRPVEARQGGQPEEGRHTTMSWTLMRALSATPSPRPAANSTCPGSRMMMLTLGSASRAAPSSIFRYCGERSQIEMAPCSRRLLSMMSRSS